MQATKKRRKSVRLQPNELAALKKFIADYTSMQEAADEIGILRNNLERLTIFGSSSPKTIDAVRARLQSKAA